MRADVLKAGHHGSPTSSSEAFLTAVQPSVAVISVGADNDYGHPGADVLARLEALNAEIYRTDTQGEIIIVSDGETLSITTDLTSREPAAGKDAPFVGNRNSMIVHSASCAKLPGEDKPAEGCAVLDIGEPLGEFRLTAYCPCMKCCGKTDGITATGTTAAEGRTIAVDPRVIPYGSSVTIYFADGTSHTYTAEDCGGAIKENRIDVFFDNHQAAREFGVQTAYVYKEEAA